MSERQQVLGGEPTALTVLRSHRVAPALAEPEEYGGHAGLPGERSSCGVLWLDARNTARATRCSERVGGVARRVSNP
jgi:hypothetical protein